MLRELIKMLRRAKQRRYIRLLEKQLAESLARNEPPALIEQRRAALMRARQRLAGILMATIIFPACARGNEALRETLEVAAIAADEAVTHCAKKHAALAGNESNKAIEARRACLKLPELGETQHAIDAVAFELEQARRWVLTGEIR